MRIKMSTRERLLISTLIEILRSEPLDDVDQLFDLAVEAKGKGYPALATVAEYFAYTFGLNDWSDYV